VTEGHVNPGSGNETTSTSLLCRVKAQEQVAWSRLVSLYSPLVYRWCRQAGVQPADAADVGQEVFQAVARKIADFRRDQAGDSFRGWLRVITRNKLVDHFRSRQASVPGVGGSANQNHLNDLAANGLPVDDSDAHLEERLLYHRAAELIRAEWDAASWQAFWRVTIDGQTPADVAGDLQISINAVYLAKSRILRRLREEFAELLEEDAV
jgi:RNA polymerase sigma-70 factor (ECF subfamily)